MMNEKRSVLKILEDAKRLSYASTIDVMLVTSVIRIMGSGPVHDRVHMHNVYNPHVHYTMEEGYTALAGCKQLKLQDLISICVYTCF